MSTRHCAHCDEQVVGRRKTCPGCALLVCVGCYAVSSATDCRSYMDVHDQEFSTCGNCGQPIPGTVYLAYRQSLTPVNGELVGIGRSKQITICRSCFIELAELEAENED